jgi:hypothetical protein
MAVGESQACSCAVSGCASRSFLVRVLYVSKAVLITSWKLKEEEVEEDEDDAAVR